MAVLKDWEASVVVYGAKLPEYDDPGDGTNEVGYSSPGEKVTKYIEAVSDSHFTIDYGFISKFPTGDMAFAVDLFVDGAFAFSGSIEPTQFSHHSSVSGIKNCTNGKWAIQKFRFAAIIHGR